MLFIRALPPFPCVGGITESAVPRNIHNLRNAVIAAAVPKSIDNRTYGTIIYAKSKQTCQLSRIARETYAFGHQLTLTRKEQKITHAT